MSQWGWTPARNLGIWRYGAGWSRPIAAAIPCLTVCLLLIMMHMIGGTMTSCRGVLFELPDGALSDGEASELVALVMPVQHETMIVFDDARYLLGDAASMRSFVEDLSGSAERRTGKALLILADTRVSTGHLMEIVSAAKRSGVGKVLLAGKREGDAE